MQHKRIISNPGRLAFLAILALGFILIALMKTTIPASSVPVEKELDAKAFLESR